MIMMTITMIVVGVVMMTMMVERMNEKGGSSLSLKM